MILGRKIDSIFILIFLILSVTICGAISEEKIVSSAKEIVALWENILSNNLDIVVYNPEMKYWHVNRLFLVNQSMYFTIKRTDSAGIPPQIMIHFSYNRWHNPRSNYANSNYEYENHILGFKTADDALSNTKNSDFEEVKYTYKELISRTVDILYVLENKTWILQAGNDHFETLIGQHISESNNANTFKKVLSVPTK